MLSLICTCIFSLLTVVFIVASIVYSATHKDKYDSSAPKVSLPVLAFLCLIGVGVSIGTGVVTKVEPSEIAYVYNPNGSYEKLHTGYNTKSMLSNVIAISTKSQINTFSEGEAADDIFGAQSLEQDYIQIVATISYRVDPDRVNEYIVRYGTKGVDSHEVYTLIKAEAKKAAESVISKRKTSDVMSNKAEVNEAAKTAFIELMKDHPIIIDSFTIDDTIAPESYELTIIAQAKLRQDMQTADLQKDLNARNAEANKIKADGEAAVAKVEAQKAADVAEINARKEASVATINAQNNAEVAKINAEKDAESKRIASDANILRSKNEAEANASILKTESAAEAEKIKTLADAEAYALEQAGKAYKENPDLYDMKKVEIAAEVQKAWAERWSGIDMGGISPTISYADISTLIDSIVAAYTDIEIQPQMEALP